MIGIYKIENKVNSKVYVGQSVNVESRLMQHRSQLRSNKHRNDYLQHAWNKYGEDNFDFELLCECEKEELNDKEIYYIAHYNSTNHDLGYNIREGGDCGAMAEETIEKLRGSGSSLSKEDVRHIKMSMYLLMDRNEIAEMYHVSPKVLTAISQGKNWSYILPELNDKIHNLKQTLIDERNQEIVSHYDNGLTITEIKNLMCLSKSIVEKAVYKYRDIKNKDSQIEKYNKIFELHNQGINDYQISKIVDVSPSTVQRYLYKNVHPLNKAGNTKVNDELREKILDMYFNQKMTSIPISKNLGISKTTVMNVVNNYKYSNTPSDLETSA